MEKGPLPPPAPEVKERDKVPADLNRRRQLGSQWTSRNLQGVCGLGPPGLVRLLPRGCPSEELCLLSPVQAPGHGAVRRWATSPNNHTLLLLPTRHSSYGRLLDDHDYGSWGNYNNPLYDDS